MFTTIAAWAGWTTVRKFLPLAIGAIAVIAGAVALWLLVVSPRLEVAKLEKKAAAEHAKRLEDGIADLKASQLISQGLARMNASELQRVSEQSKKADVRTTVVRERIVEAAGQAGPQPVGAASRAYFDGVAAERAGVGK